MKPFSKPYLPVPAQIALLKARGLTITDDGRATAALAREIAAADALEFRNQYPAYVADSAVYARIPAAADTRCAAHRSPAPRPLRKLHGGHGLRRAAGIRHSIRDGCRSG
jgi:hypothetical protein